MGSNPEHCTPYGSWPRNYLIMLAFSRMLSRHESQVRGVPISRGFMCHWLTAIYWLWWMYKFVRFSHILFSSYLIFYQKRKCVTTEVNVSVIHRKNILFFFWLLLKDTLVGGALMQDCQCVRLTLELFASCFPALRCSQSDGWRLNSALVHRDHVCCGLAHPCCAHGVLCAKKQRWQICRYAATPATRHAVHGKRSVSLA